MLEEQKKTMTLEELNHEEMCLLEEEKARKQREEHHKMKEELMKFKIEADNLKYEN